MMLRHRTKAGVVLETLLILIGLGLIVKGLMVATDTYKFVQIANQTEGTVVAVGSYGLSLDIQFLGTSEGGAAFQQQGLLFGHEIGDSVPVLYDPSNPATAEIDSFGALWFKPMGMVILGLVSLTVGFRLRAARSI